MTDTQTQSLAERLREAINDLIGSILLDAEAQRSAAATLIDEVLLPAIALLEFARTPAPVTLADKLEELRAGIGLERFRIDISVYPEDYPEARTPEAAELICRLLAQALGIKEEIEHREMLDTHWVRAKDWGPEATRSVAVFYDKEVEEHVGS